MSFANGNRQRIWLLAIFILSGFAGLIYQSIWSHYLGLFLGHAAYAQALVLAIFMGGMAAGASWIARSGQRWRNLIRGYAIIEAVIGILGLLFHWVFTATAQFSYEWIMPLIGAPWAVNLTRWIIAALLIFPQTLLLGMTFPLMSGGLIRRFPGREGSLLGGLYFTNSIGAAIGALAAVFLLLPWFGLPGAMVCASILNFLVAGLAWWLAIEPEPTVQSSGDKGAPEQRILHNPLLRLVLIGTALSGASSFIYEIVWIRMLSMAVGSTMHAFELMLASFILGIALGGFWVRKHADNADSPIRLVGWMQIFMGIAALASLAVYANAFSWVGWTIESLAKTDGGYTLFNAGTAAISIAIMLPAAFFAGTTLPLFTVALLRSGHGERAIGRVYAWNTLGAIVGVFSAIHFFIPLMGLKLSLCVAALIDLGIGLTLLRLNVDTRKAVIGFGMAIGLSLIALIIAVRIPFDPMKLASGVFRHGKSTLDASSKVVYMRDGKTASVSVVTSADGSAHIATNGKPDAGVMMRDDGPPTEDEPTMVLAAVLPLSMLDAPKKVGVIGFGSGLTTHTLLGDSRIQHVDTIEIEPAMVDGARFFGRRVERAYTDKRSSIIIDDAKSIFSGKKAKYDLIISEPSNPWISGVSSLFTEEFYQFIPNYLNDGGLFVQWVQLYEIDEELIGSILRSLTPAFEDYGAWLTNNSDLLIVASPKGPLPKSDIGRLLSVDGPLRAELARQDLNTQARIDFRKVADSVMLRGLGSAYGKLPANSDYFPILGLEAPKARFQGTSASAIATLPYQAPILLEALNIREPLPAGLRPSKLGHFTADMMTWRARALTAELTGGDGMLLAPEIINGRALAPAALLKAAVPHCGHEWNDSQIERLSAHIREVADMTINYMPPASLQGVWKKRNWIDCKKIPRDLENVFSLVASIADRNFPEMERQGRNLLENPPGDGLVRRDFGEVALSAVMLAHTRERKWERLLAAEAEFGQKIVSRESYQLHREIMKSIAINELKK
ncbi:MAG: fused MFS/spermidine synthase [Comamonas sp.]|nr:fused MFS/spermidine synthase [Comamonas sp.]